MHASARAAGRMAWRQALLRRGTACPHAREVERLKRSSTRVGKARKAAAKVCQLL